MWPTPWISGSATGGTVLVQPFATTHLVVDIYGYFIDVEELQVSIRRWGTAPSSAQHRHGQALNTATGALALLNNTTGSSNTATGDLALLNNTTGTANTATGSEALLMNVTGQGNTAAGAAALRKAPRAEKIPPWGTPPFSTTRATGTPLRGP